MKAAEPGFVYDIHRDKLIAFGGSAVGFKIVTITDSSRVIKALYNYFGEKETGDL